MPQPALLLLPGLLCDAAVWHHQINTLSDVVSIIVPDLSKANTPAEMVAAVLKVAPASFMLAGHSMGGWVALEVMRSAPQRVLKLCLANTTAKLDTAEKAAARKEMISLATQGEYENIINRLAAAFVYQKKYLPLVTEMLHRNQHAFINQEQAMLIRQDCVPVLKDITCPTLVIHSVQDAVFNINDSEQLAFNIKQATLEIIEEAGHMSLMEQPEKFSALMRAWVQQTIG